MFDVRETGWQNVPIIRDHLACAVQEHDVLFNVPEHAFTGFGADRNEITTR
jgi:hypothetical protein